MKIDKYSLDDNWEEFQQESEEVTKQYAKAVSDRDKFEVEVLNKYLSALDLEIRSSPEQFGLQKVTDKAVEAIINGDEKAIELKLEFIDLDTIVRDLKGKNIQVSRDRDALENLTKLYLNNYYFERPLLDSKERDKLEEQKKEDSIRKELNTPEVKEKMKKSKLKLKKG